ncbi:glyoxalase [Microbacterium sp. CSI-V]|uniref:VOC family protein n=1 Tax=unclassified Microbacterium TaxID=2609290 RepID=UPI00097C66EA|nr:MULTISPECIES: VOC family protein [unclassified Microbacterium]MXS75311.1 glyoxalase [Microbacterium sp. TL13]ONI66345.1 glyoxalase [Microbacterium sp. CSI-V]
MRMRLELIPLTVSDVDRSIAFYRDVLGFALDHDVSPGNGMRVVQLTPPGSACSIAFGTGMGGGAPVANIHLVVDDLETTRATLVSRGLDVSGIHDMGGGVRYAFFSDPDANTWALQEISPGASLPE